MGTSHKTAKQEFSAILIYLFIYLFNVCVKGGVGTLFLATGRIFGGGKCRLNLGGKYA